MSDNDDFVSYGTAMRLKRAGFDLPCYFYYTREDAPGGCVWSTASEEAPIDYNRRVYAGCSMPTLAQAQKWLREEKGIAVNIQAAPMNHKLWYSADIYSLEFEDVLVDGGFPFPTYESALSAGIEAALKLIEGE